MKNVALPLAASFLALTALGAGTGCGVLGSNDDITYDVPPQEVLQDVSQALSGLSGNFPTVDCTASATGGTAASAGTKA